MTLNKRDDEAKCSLSCEVGCEILDRKFNVCVGWYILLWSYYSPFTGRSARCSKDTPLIARLALVVVHVNKACNRIFDKAGYSYSSYPVGLSGSLSWVGVIQFNTFTVISYTWRHYAAILLRLLIDHWTIPMATSASWFGIVGSFTPAAWSTKEAAPSSPYLSLTLIRSHLHHLGRYNLRLL
jgi:hypothetical protein